MYYLSILFNLIYYDRSGTNLYVKIVRSNEINVLRKNEYLRHLVTRLGKGESKIEVKKIV